LDSQLRWFAASRRSWWTSLGVSSVRLRLQPCFNCCSAVLHMSPNPIADRALPVVAPAIERVYRNSEHLGQVRDRHESLAHIERHDHLRSIRDQHGHSDWCRWQPTACQTADRLRLLTMTGTHPSHRDDHSLDSGRPAEKDQNLPSCFPKDMSRRSAVSA
jgi:hypothetical protein